MRQIKDRLSRRAYSAPMDQVSPRAKIAIVEDDASLLNALTFALQTDRYVVAPFSTGKRALQDCGACQCLVVDLNLPDMDGLTLIDELRALGVIAPAILITTHPDTKCRQRAAASDVAIVEKPLLGSELSKRIAAAIGG